MAFLLADLGVVKTQGRPHVSDDNSYIESGFKTPERARKLADELRHVDLDDGGSMRARNLAAAALDFVLAEVRAAARYLFADEPRVLAPFLSRDETLRKARARSRRKAQGPAGAPSPTPEEA